MIYIVVLNWNSAQNTIQCVKSLLHLNKHHEIKILICDNDSKEYSYQEIHDYLISSVSSSFIAINESDVANCVIKENIKTVLIKNNKNYGYAGGNNVGLRLALKQENMQYCWVLNNDTEVAIDALDHLVSKMQSDSNIGLCGSRLVDFETKKNVQALGGVINPWLCTTKELGSELFIDDSVNELEWENKIDFVVGASLFFSKISLQKVGLLCEDYFLYFEEVDYCNRLKNNGLKVGVASKSIVFHEQGSSTKNLSEIADYCQVKNRLLISKKFYSNKYLIVKASLILVILNRLKRRQYNRAIKYLKLMLSFSK